MPKEIRALVLVEGVEGVERQQEDKVEVEVEVVDIQRN
jgi:hypothetical protein